VGGQWLFTVYAHAPSTFRPARKSIFAGVYIKNSLDKVEWAQHSVVSAEPRAVRAGRFENVDLTDAQQHSGLAGSIPGKFGPSVMLHSRSDNHLRFGIATW